jgi:hypothetical protein
MNTNQKLILPTKLNLNKSTIYTNLVEKLLKTFHLVTDRQTKKSRRRNAKRQYDPRVSSGGVSRGDGGRIN